MATDAARPTIRSTDSRTARSPARGRSSTPAWSSGSGSAWILDGLQITIASSVTGRAHPARHARHDLDRGRADRVGLPRRPGRRCARLRDGSPTSSGGKRLLIVTLLLYLLGTGLAAFTVNDGGWLWLVYFYGTRFVAGIGIGGEYSAINSAVDELIPRPSADASTSRSTARTGSAPSSPPSPAHLLTPDVGRTSAGGWASSWARCSGSATSRPAIPESPRWLPHPRKGEEAERMVAQVEHVVAPRASSSSPWIEKRRRSSSAADAADGLRPMLRVLFCTTRSARWWA